TFGPHLPSSALAAAGAATIGSAAMAAATIAGTGSASGGARMSAAPSPAAKVADFARRESVIAGTLQQLAQNKMYPMLREMFFPSAMKLDIEAFNEIQAIIDPLTDFD